MIDGIRHARDFRRLREHGRTVRAGAVRIRVLADDIDGARVAFAVGRSYGNAVARNRVRRQLRSIFRDADRRGVLAPGWYLVSVDGGAVLSWSELLGAVDSALAPDIRR